MTVTDVPTIQLQAGGPQPTVVEGAGWVQTTPPGKAERTYRDTARADDRWEATDQTFSSLTAILGRGIPTDWTGPAKWNVARGAVADWDRLALLPEDERVREMVSFADSSLNQAADRGSAGHRAIEDLLHGSPVNRDDLRTHGALPWLLAIERFLEEAGPVATLLEAVCFDRELGVAGTVDFVGTLDHPDAPEGLLVADWKFRANEHDRRPKEAAQVAGYAHMLTEHYFMDERGSRRRLQVDAAAVVTFAPDGTWALHPVDLDAGKAHYRRAAEMARGNLVSRLYGKAVKAEAPDVNALARERLARIPDGTPERAALASRWMHVGLGAPSRDELTIDDWPVVDDLLAVAERAPWPPERLAPTVYAPADEVQSTLDELAALPADLRARLNAANAPLFRRWERGATTQDDLDDMNRLIGTVHEEAVLRVAEVENLLALGEEYPLEVRYLLFQNCPVHAQHWTDVDVERVAALWSALDAGDLVVRDGRLAASVRAAEDLAAAGKREAVTKAKPLAELHRRPKPQKWADLVADPILFAAVLAA